MQLIPVFRGRFVLAFEGIFASVISDADGHPYREYAFVRMCATLTLATPALSVELRSPMHQRP